MAIEYKYNPLDLEPDKAIGIKLPFNASAPGKRYDTVYNATISGASIFPLSYTTEEQAISNLKNLILTKKGERLYHPDFGTRLQSLLFENINSDFFTDEVENSLKEDIGKWLPYIFINSIDVNVLPYKSISDVTNGISVLIDFRLRNSESNQTIAIQFDGNTINIQ